MDVNNIGKRKTCAVVIATYNGQKYIKDQLQSILKQTRKPDFICISDDNSSDDTVRICRKILDTSRIRYQININASSLGVTQNFMNAAKNIEQDVVFFSDQDDVWLQNKIELMMYPFEKDAHCMEVLSDAYIWDGNNKPKNRLIQQLHNNIYPTFRTSDGKFDINSFWRVAIQKNIATGMSMAVSREVAHTTKQDIIMLHDSWYNLIAGALGSVYVIDLPLALYRQHKTNVEGAYIKFSFDAVRRSKQRVMKSILERDERNRVIASIDNKYQVLNKDNKNFYFNFVNKSVRRKLYLKNGNSVKMVRFVTENKEFYTSKLLMIRDVLVSYINSK